MARDTVTFSRSFCFLPGPLATEVPEQTRRHNRLAVGPLCRDSTAVGLRCRWAPKVDEMNLSFEASSRFSSDWKFLKLLRDPSRKRRVGLSDDSSDREGVSSEGGKAPRALLVEPREIPNESMRLLERVEGRWL